MVKKYVQFFCLFCMLLLTYKLIVHFYNPNTAFWFSLMLIIIIKYFRVSFKNE